MTGKPLLDIRNGWNPNDLGKTNHDPSNGRFPANLLVSDDVLNDGTTSKSSVRKSKTPGGFGCAINTFGDGENGMVYGNRGCNDSGSFSRFFDLDAWWDAKIPELKKDVQKTFPFMLVPKAGKGEKNEGVKDNNIHPTVKPLKLMSYLITLGSRPGDIILDPYGGSGTTGIAAYQLNRDFILFESEPEYHEIAKARLKNEKNKKRGFNQW